MHTRRSGDASHVEADGPAAEPLRPAERRLLLRLPRWREMPRGAAGTWTTKLARGSHDLELAQRVTGTRLRSRLEQRLGDQPWWSGREARSLTWEVDDGTIEVESRAVFGGLSDDVEVVLHEAAVGDPIPPHALDLLVWNVWLRPWMWNGQRKRARLLRRSLSGHDVVVLNEAFHRWVVPPLLRSLSEEYPHQTPVLGKRSLPKPIGPGTKFWNGGVVIISRWPIERTDARTFRGHLAPIDLWSDKGVLYAKLRKNGRPYHLFATHVQADAEAYIRPLYSLRGIDPEEAFVAYRRANLRIVARFIEELAIPEDEPVIIAGDLNTDSMNDPDEFERVRELLGAQGYGGADGSPGTFSPGTNQLATGDVDGWLDHVLWSRAHLMPSAAVTRVALIRARTPWRHWLRRHWDLSDHYGVNARLEFGATEEAPSPAPADE